MGVLLNVETQLLGHPVFEITPTSEHTKQGTQTLEHLTPPPTSYSRRRQSQIQAGSSRPCRRAGGGAPRLLRCNTSPGGCSRSCPIRRRLNRCASTGGGA